MIVFRPLMVAAALVLASTATLAFQEQQTVAPVASSKSGVAAQLDVPAVVVADSASKGTPVRIPGLGTLGVIPKMDFGLELLYGVTDPNNTTKRPDLKSSDGDDVLIRGAIKHKF